jgi:adenylate cyclase
VTTSGTAGGGVEIERKFLVPLYPDSEPASVSSIRQSYVVIADDGSELRVRERDGRYEAAYKSGGATIRREAEIEIGAAVFEELWGISEGRCVEKQRHCFPHGELTVELDVYGGPLDGLLVAEVEFTSLEESEVFVPLHWFGREVTADRRYKTQSLAVHGLPRDAKP